MTSQVISHSEFSKLHPASIQGASRVRSILEQAREAGVSLFRGLNRRVEPETARILEISDDTLLLETENFAETGRHQVFLRFELKKADFFFSAERRTPEDQSPLTVSMPEVVYRKERRARARRPVLEGSRVFLESAGHLPIEGRLLDVSGDGMAVLTRHLTGHLSHDRLAFRIEGGQSAGFAEITGVSSGEEGWAKLHLRTSPVPFADPVEVERRPNVITPSWRDTWRTRITMASGAALSAGERALRRFGVNDASPVPVVDFETEDGENIRGILDLEGDPAEGLAVVIPPAWGRTKETLLPLAETLLASFRAASRPLAVLRFDGIRKRGESFNDPECTSPGQEHKRFTFYQGVKDIRAAVRYVREETGARRVVLVTFSASSIEARKFLAEDRGSSADAWVCVVGTADMQSMMRVISGGVDYIGGMERGISFGDQEILGVTVDIDYAGHDAFRHKIAFLSDSRRDFHAIQVPVLWIHGRFDAWMDLDPVREVLACGKGDRRLIEVPTGHQLRSSREAVDVFRLISEEVSEHCPGGRIESRPPSVAAVTRRTRIERARIRRDEADLGSFWERYLLGGSQGLGIELMNHTPDYRSFMDLQVEALELQPGRQVLDLGSGSGALPRHLLSLATHRATRVLEADLVRSALVHTRTRLNEEMEDANICVRFLNCRLGEGSIPLADASCESVLASLLLSYVPNPAAVVEEIVRVTRPRGRVVVSTMRKDADISAIYSKAIKSIAAGDFDSAWPGVSRGELMAAGRDFLNDAARLMDFEENGDFQFWDEDGLRRLLERSGLEVLDVFRAFGTPPQAIVATAVRCS